MTDLTIVIEITIALLGAILTAFVVPWLKSRLTEAQTEELLVWVRIGVAAAQQLYHQMDGSERLNYVLSFLENKGYNVDSETVRGAIEAEVLKLHQQLEGTSV